MVLVGEDVAKGARAGAGGVRDRVQRSRARSRLECSRRLRTALWVQSPRAVWGVAVGALLGGFITRGRSAGARWGLRANREDVDVDASVQRGGAHTFGLAELADPMGARWVARQPTRLLRRCSVRRRSGRCRGEHGRQARRLRQLAAARSRGEVSSPSPQLRPVSADCRGASELAGNPHESLKTHIHEGLPFGGAGE